MLKEFVKIGDTLMEVCDSRVRCKENLLNSVRTIPPSSLKNDYDMLGVLVDEVIPLHSCLVFCGTKISCENVSQKICGGERMSDNLIEQG